MKLIQYLTLIFAFVFLAACELPADTSSQEASSNTADNEFGVQMIDGVKKKTIEGFGGVIAESYEDSEEWWPPYEEPDLARGDLRRGA